ncbi:hypothetical protein BKA58DRAFT_88081 [Alternaria rosae]|uniref:uncharacterized protein n=1 Tax=Alternaria rosae TaxID=1187941 RepID=UPI001E8E4312|nr:uncharacterized protein BKA58DRAFT_88081 [Alternaria rosae]KAH6878057.1 hypothetical protein BKA58DRAFT_88081 [Alternaria rosae]
MPFSLRSFLKPASYNDSVSYTDRLLAQIFSWSTLFGYLLYPSFFPQLNTIDEYAGCVECKEYWDCSDVYDTPPSTAIQISDSFYLCALACCIGLLGWLYLWWKYQRNHQWLLNWVFYPAFVNSLAGVGMAVSKVVCAPEGQYSVILKVAMVAPSAASAVAAVLALWYYGAMFRIVKRKEDVEPAALEKEKERDEES